MGELVPMPQQGMFRAAASAIIERLQWMRQAGLSFKGARDLYEVLGYARELSAKDFRDRYDRGGVAGRIVDALPNAAWRGEMELIEDEDPKTETEFEKAWYAMDTRLHLQATMLRSNILARLSTYSVLLLCTPGDDLTQELPRAKKPEDLVKVMPFTGGGGPSNSRTQRAIQDSIGIDVNIYAFDTDPGSPRFGMPTAYQFRRMDVSNPLIQRPVHWTRVIHVTEGLLDDEVFGRPALQRPWNLLDDLDKITGGGSEAFWLRANQGLHIDIDKDLQLGDAVKEKEDLKNQAEEYKHQQVRWLRTRGVKVDTLGSDVANFSGPADAVLTQIAGTVGIPKRILTGSEMGELASSQDRDNWKDQVNGYQQGTLGPLLVRQLVDRLIEYGYLPTPKEYRVKWPHIEVMTESEKADGASKWAATNQQNGSVVYTSDEIRDKWYGMPPLTPEQKKTMLEDKQAATTASTPPPGPAEMAKADALKKGLKAAEDPLFEEEIRVLEAAMAAGDRETIDRMLGFRALWPDATGFDDHGRGDPTGRWKSEGGFEHTGIHWKQATDPKTGRPIPIRVRDIGMAALLVQDGKVVEVPDIRTAHTLIDHLAQMAQEAKAAGKEAKDYDLCNVSVAGTNMFCADTLRNAEYPEGIPRLAMPQLGGKPVPGSEADKLPRNPWDPNEVDGAAHFVAHLQGIGVSTSRETVPAASLKASQREMIGSKVGAMMRDKNFDPGKNPVFVSSDNYVVDGHHRWAAVMGRDAEDGKLGDKPMNVTRVNAPISEVLHLANAWADKFGIAQVAGVKAQAAKTGLRVPK